MISASEEREQYEANLQQETLAALNTELEGIVTLGLEPNGGIGGREEDCSSPRRAGSVLQQNAGDEGSTDDGIGEVTSGTTRARRPTTAAAHDLQLTVTVRDGKFSFFA